MARRKWNYETIQQVLDGGNPFIQVGYSKGYERRNDGDEWTDTKGVTWKKTNGSIVRVNKQMDDIREIIRPRCSVCNMDMNLFGNKIDNKVFNKTGLCFDCLEIKEQTLKLNGKYEEYEFQKLVKNKLATLKEFRKNVMESIEYLKKDDCKMEMVHSNGEITTWTGAQNSRILKEAKEDLIKADKEISELEVVVSSWTKQ